MTALIVQCFAESRCSTDRAGLVTAILGHRSLHEMFFNVCNTQLLELFGVTAADAALG